MWNLQELLMSKSLCFSLTVFISCYSWSLVKQHKVCLQHALSVHISLVLVPFFIAVFLALEENCMLTSNPTNKALIGSVGFFPGWDTAFNKHNAKPMWITDEGDVGSNLMGWKPESVFSLSTVKHFIALQYTVLLVISGCVQQLDWAAH